MGQRRLGAGHLTLASYDVIQAEKKLFRNHLEVLNRLLHSEWNYLPSYQKGAFYLSEDLDDDNTAARYSPSPTFQEQTVVLSSPTRAKHRLFPSRGNKNSTPQRHHSAPAPLSLDYSALVNHGGSSTPSRHAHTASHSPAFLRNKQYVGQTTRSSTPTRTKHPVSDSHAFLRTKPPVNHHRPASSRHKKPASPIPAPLWHNQQAIQSSSRNNLSRPTTRSPPEVVSPKSTSPRSLQWFPPSRLSSAKSERLLQSRCNTGSFQCEVLGPTTCKSCTRDLAEVRPSTDPGLLADPRMTSLGGDLNDGHPCPLCVAQWEHAANTPSPRDNLDCFSPHEVFIRAVAQANKRESGQARSVASDPQPSPRSVTFDTDALPSARSEYKDLDTSGMTSDQEEVYPLQIIVTFA